MEAFAGKSTLPMQDTAHGHSILSGYVDMQIQYQLQCQQQHAASQSMWQSRNRQQLYAADYQLKYKKERVF